MAQNLIGKVKIRNMKQVGKGTTNFSKTQITRAILDDLVAQMNVKIKANKSSIRKEIRAYIKDAITKQATTQELQDGHKLAGDFGFHLGSAKGRTEAIINQVVASASIQFPRFRRSRDRIVGGLVFGIIISDYSDIEALQEAKVITDNQETLEWLKWLLERGSEVVIRTHYVKYRSKGPIGRSGEAVMLPTVKGIGFRVDSDHSGTEDDNWLTRTFVKGTVSNGTLQPDFEAFLDGLFTKYLA